MFWKICYISGCEVTAFAARELKRYLFMIDKDADVAHRFVHTWKGIIEGDEPTLT